MKNKLLLSGKMLAILLSVFLLGACSKERTQGPTGSQGEQGLTGSQGAKGDKGDQGTTDVIYSDWITKTQSDWKGIGANIASTTIAVPKLTTDIKDRRVILCYTEYQNE